MKQVFCFFYFLFIFLNFIEDSIKKVYSRHGTEVAKVFPSLLRRVVKKKMFSRTRKTFRLDVDFVHRVLMGS